MVAALGTGAVVASPAQAASVWDGVAACESGGNWSINTGNGFYGGLQFTHSTWIGNGGGAYASNANQASKAAQITVARRVLANQGPGAWPVCSRRAGLTRSNGGSGSSFTVSRSMVRHHVVSHHNGALAVDGVLGPLTRASARRHGVQIYPVRALQHRLHVRVDGALGPITVRALQRYLNAR
jgi:hypothetical protein